MNEGLIYKAVSKVNNKVYIGETTWSLENRKKKHFERSKSGAKEKFMCALRKYGKDGFDWSVVEKITAKTPESLALKLHLREQYYIDQYNSIKSGYNILYGRPNLGGCAGKYNPAYIKINIPKKEFIKLCKAGKTRKELATHFSVPFNHVRIFLERLWHTNFTLKEELSKRQYLIKRHRSKWDEKLFETITKMTNEGVGKKDISMALKITYKKVRYYQLFIERNKNGV